MWSSNSSTGESLRPSKLASMALFQQNDHLCLVSDLKDLAVCEESRYLITFFATQLFGVEMLGCVTYVPPKENEMEVRMQKVWLPLAVFQLQPSPWPLLGRCKMMQQLGVSPALVSNSDGLGGMSTSVMVFVRGRCCSLTPQRAWIESQLSCIVVGVGQHMCMDQGRSYKFSYNCSVLIVARLMAVQLDMQLSCDLEPYFRWEAASETMKIDIFVHCSAFLQNFYPELIYLGSYTGGHATVSPVLSRGKGFKFRMLNENESRDVVLLVPGNKHDLPNTSAPTIYIYGLATEEDPPHATQCITLERQEARETLRTHKHDGQAGGSMREAVKTLLLVTVLLLVSVSLSLGHNSFGMSVDIAQEVSSFLCLWILFCNFGLAYYVVTMGLESAHEVVVVVVVVVRNVEYVFQKVGASYPEQRKITAAV